MEDAQLEKSFSLFLQNLFLLEGFDEKKITCLAFILAQVLEKAVSSKVVKLVEGGILNFVLHDALRTSNNPLKQNFLELLEALLVQRGFDLSRLLSFNHLLLFLVRNQNFEKSLFMLNYFQGKAFDFKIGLMRIFEERNLNNFIFFVKKHLQQPEMLFNVDNYETLLKSGKEFVSELSVNPKILQKKNGFQKEYFDFLDIFNNRNLDPKIRRNAIAEVYSFILKYQAFEENQKFVLMVFETCVDSLFGEQDPDIRNVLILVVLNFLLNYSYGFEFKTRQVGRMTEAIEKGDFEFVRNTFVATLNGSFKNFYHYFLFLYAVLFSKNLLVQNMEGQLAALCEQSADSEKPRPNFEIFHSSLGFTIVEDRNKLVKRLLKHYTLYCPRRAHQPGDLLQTLKQQLSTEFKFIKNKDEFR